MHFLAKPIMPFIATYYSQILIDIPGECLLHSTLANPQFSLFNRVADLHISKYIYNIMSFILNSEYGMLVRVTHRMSCVM